MAIHLKLKPHSPFSHIPSLRLLSSSSSSSPFPPSHDSPPEDDSQSHSPTIPADFSTIKQRLGSPASPLRGIPTDPSPPPSLYPPKSHTSSLEQIRKHLADFRRHSSPSASSIPSSSSSATPPRFQEIFKNKIQNNNNNAFGSGQVQAQAQAQAPSFDAIRQNLQQNRSRDPFFSLKSLQESIRGQNAQSGAPSIIGSEGRLPESIFAREARESKIDEGVKGATRLNTQFVKDYTQHELGEKLAKLRPEGGDKKKEGFSLNELNQRLAKLRQMEDELARSANPAACAFDTIRESIKNLKDGEEYKKRQQRMPILTNLAGVATPTYMLKPPQEQLLEKYFHPDHMSSAEKMKLELKKVRDEFKMSESDCGSTRVQVVQLTTKIKYLSTVLKKKDKHSIKGLQEMVQRRKKLLKYLRRTDWDSYCLVLSKLGLRDVPEYKAPDYKAKIQTKAKSKSKKKSKSKSRMKA